MHPTIEQLLASTSAPRDAGVASHLEHCARCRSDLDVYQSTAQRLRALPMLEPDSAAWGAVQSRLSRSTSAGWRRAGLRAVAGIAVVAIVVAWAVGQRGLNTPEAPRLAEYSTTDELVALMDQSRQLDLMLQELPNRPRVERVTMAATLDSIEDRIQWLDAQLTHGAVREQDEQHMRTLWRERVELMDSLVKVRYAQAGTVSF